MTVPTCYKAKFTCTHFFLCKWESANCVEWSKTSLVKRAKRKIRAIGKIHAQKEWPAVAMATISDRLHRRIHRSVRVTTAGRLTISPLRLVTDRPPAGSCPVSEAVRAFHLVSRHRSIFHDRSRSASNRPYITTLPVASSSRVTCPPFRKVMLSIRGQHRRRLLRTVRFHRRCFLRRLSDRVALETEPQVTLVTVEWTFVTRPT